MISNVQHGSATPPEIQEQANSWALEYWRSLKKDILREELLTEEELERIKPKVLGFLALAFSRGSFVVMKTGLESLEALKGRGKKRRPR